VDSNLRLCIFRNIIIGANPPPVNLQEEIQKNEKKSVYVPKGMFFCIMETPNMARRDSKRRSEGTLVIQGKKDAVQSRIDAAWDPMQNRGYARQW
jgi:hypothetical protein